MKTSTPPKFQLLTMTTEVKNRLLTSEIESQDLTDRPLKCPHCNFLIQMLCSDATGHIKVKCPKCKAGMILNVVYFRNKPKRFSGYKKQYNR